MKITIRRGADEIGGTCIEVGTEKTRLLLDLGRPLGKSQSRDGETLPGSFDGIDAVLITHPHQDHYGLIEAISTEIPVYMGELGEKFIKAVRLFLCKPSLKNNFKSFKAGEKFKIGDLEITPYLVDHSAADAYSFLIEGEGKRLFYSGDFRAHGRKSKLFERILRKPPKDIDVLLMEGTMLGRENGEFSDERAVEEKMVEHLRGETGVSFLICSSQNIDRIVTAYRAAKRANRVFVVDIYTAWILNEISKFSKRVPTIEWSDVRVLAKGLTAKNHYLTVKENPEYFEGFVRTLYKKGNVIAHEDIRKWPQRYFIKNPMIRLLINFCDLQRAGVVYSQWKGYMSPEYNPERYNIYKELRDDTGINFVYAHTSGHAVLEDLKRFAEAISPKMLVPVHTEHKERYSEYFKNVRILEDGEELALI